jgi:hypothetical protein
MKKAMIVALGLAVVASASYAQTNPVLSRNAVGYIRRQIDANQLDFIGAPFVRLEGGAQNTVSNLFPNPLNGSSLLKWDIPNQRYIQISAKGTTWGLGGSNLIARGEGVFVRTPGGTTQTFYVLGEVPDKFSATSTVVTVGAGVTFLANGYPVPVLWTSTTLAAQLPNGSQFVLWNRTNGSYDPYSKKGTAWQPASATNVLLKPGDAFYVRQPGGATNINWTETKPYTWP